MEVENCSKHARVRIMMLRDQTGKQKEMDSYIPEGILCMIEEEAAVP